MSEPAGPSLAAIQARQSALANQHGSVADADRVLADVVASAHAAIRESVRRLDAIADEIDRAVPNQAGLAVDTPLGARGVSEIPGCQTTRDRRSRGRCSRAGSRESGCAGRRFGHSMPPPGASQTPSGALLTAASR